MSLPLNLFFKQYQMDCRLQAFYLFCCFSNSSGFCVQILIEVIFFKISMIVLENHANMAVLVSIWSTAFPANVPRAGKVLDVSEVRIIILWNSFYLFSCQNHRNCWIFLRSESNVTYRC